MAPNNSPAGKRKRQRMIAVAQDTAMRSAISGGDEPPGGPRITGSAGATSPNSASPAGIPVVSSSTRMVCTIAIAGRSAPSSVESAMTCVIEPGLAPSKAESRSQPCTMRR
jgi:hypothetical protein